jgi:DNA-directed RNA polymerase subunit RPC12/RpoP
MWGKAPRVEGALVPKGSAADTVPGFLCEACSQAWNRDQDANLRGGDPCCPFCGARQVVKWRVKP